MIWLKQCPRCQGDLVLDQDHYGSFKTCVQCGYLRDLVDTAVGANPAASGAVPGQWAVMPASA
jgi:hypothetical protein